MEPHRASDPAIRLLRRELGILGVLAVVAAVGGPFLQGYSSSVATQMFLWVGMATAWNLLGGLAGYVSLGSQASFGIGAFAAGIAMTPFAWPFAPALALAAAVGGASAWLLGYPILRIRGHYFILGSFALASAIGAAALNMRFFGIRGGGTLNLPILALPAAELSHYFYFVMLGFAVLSLSVYIGIAHSRTGLALRMIRSDEDVAGALGVDTTRYKLIAFSLSGVLFALGGAIRAYWFTRVEAGQVFDAALVIQVLVMVVLGGVGTTWGPALGAVIVLLLAQAAGGFESVNVFVYATVIIAVAMLRPGGLAEVFGDVSRSVVRFQRRAEGRVDRGGRRP